MTGFGTFSSVTDVVLTARLTPSGKNVTGSWQKIQHIFLPRHVDSLHVLDNGGFRHTDINQRDMLLARWSSGTVLA